MCGILALEIAGEYSANDLTRGEVHVLGYPIDGKPIRLLNIRINNWLDQSIGYARSGDLILLYIGPINVTVLYKKVNALRCHKLK